MPDLTQTPLPPSQRLSGLLGDGTTCVIFVEGSDLRAEIDRRHDHPRQMFKADEIIDPLVVTIAANKIATLRGVIRVRRQANFVTSYENYKANLSFIGPAQFSPDEKVKELYFRPTNERLAVMYTGHRYHAHVGTDDIKLSAILDSPMEGFRYEVDVIDYDRCQAFEAISKHVIMSGNVEVTTQSDVLGHHVTEARQVMLNYECPTDITAALQDMFVVCNFMSLMIGEVVSPTTVKARTADDDDSQTGIPRYDIYGRWRAPGKELRPQDGRRCMSAPLLGQTEFQTALAIWMDRKETWQQSYELGAQCLLNQNESSRRRFLDAAAWFESIPLFYQTPRTQIDKKTIAHAAEMASQAFIDRGAEVAPSRAQALLGNVNATSLGAKIADAMLLARSGTYASFLKPSLDAIAKAIPKIRGSFAHGEDAFLGRTGHLVYEATLLLEVLSAVLTLDGLPGIRIVPEAGGHPLRQSLYELSGVEIVG